MSFQAIGLSAAHIGARPVQSLALEITIGAGQMLLTTGAGGPRAARLALTLAADGTLWRRRGRHWRALLAGAGRAPPPAGASAFLTLSWARGASAGRAVLECPATGYMAAGGIDDAALLGDDPAALAARARPGAAVSSICAHPGPLPVGEVPTIAQGSLVATPGGMRPIEALGPGAAVLDSAGHAHRVRAITGRTLPPVGRFRPLRLRAPYLGLMRDVIVTPEQPVAISGTLPHYLFGRPTVLIEARALVHTGIARPLAADRPIRCHQLALPRQILLNVSGAALASRAPGRPPMLAAPLLGPSEARAVAAELARR